MSADAPVVDDLCLWVRERLQVPPSLNFGADTPLAPMPGVDSLFYAELLNQVLSRVGGGQSVPALKTDSFATLRALTNACQVRHINQGRT